MKPGQTAIFQVKMRLLGVKVKGKGRVLDITLLHDEHIEPFTILEVAADWHELIMIPQHIIRPSTACACCGAACRHTANGPQ